ncbi:DUF3108 domain-containing protein [Gilvimarinus agarilyticus]|uniref:DUF3108 domain-containing protein n=1 Tax=Gilvimarinus sp. 2_MG-2023 TaxID=3062666 RepID=UPI001C0A1B40|nr:DUF3108 domain-containing protein [Gilvimarinus sp. 2_MG-2023]MBU2886852.1 DUF3108 domain-containing protein [Gilvimarinus agarilyticus]MDO6571513.1 DUF3108 domain-containing protein [Gilvimarinus sp. 2_MG-2023]
MRLIPTLFVLGLSLLPVAVTANAPEQEQPDTETANQATPPKQFKNIYRARAYGIGITVTHELTPTDSGHKLRFFADSFVASIEEISHFDWPTPERLRPTSYTYERSGLGRDRSAKLDFDWETGKVTNNVQDKPWKMTIEPGVLDKLSFQIQLQHDLIAGKTENLAYDIADGGRLKHYQFEVVAEETLETPLGKVDTVKIKRSREDDDRITYAWMAPKYDYLLVRMQQEEGSKVYTIYIHESEVDGETISAFE